MKKIIPPEDMSHPNFDTVGPIDYQSLKEFIAKNGPLSVVFDKWSIAVTINITPCLVENCECSEDVISLVLASGYTSLSTLIERDQLEEFDSLVSLASTYLHRPYMIFGSSAECQYIEKQVNDHLGINPTEVFRDGCQRQSKSEPKGSAKCCHFRVGVIADGRARASGLPRLS